LSQPERRVKLKLVDKSESARQLAEHRDSAQNPPIGYRCVSDMWSLVNRVREVESNYFT